METPDFHKVHFSEATTPDERHGYDEDEGGQLDGGGAAGKQPRRNTLLYFIRELQGATPVLLLLFALVAAGYLIADGVTEAKVRSQQRKTEAAVITASYGADLGRAAESAGGMLAVGRELRTKLEKLGMEGRLDATGFFTKAAAGEYEGASMALMHLQQMLSVEVLKEEDDTGSAAALAYARSWSIGVAMQHFKNPLQVAEGISSEDISEALGNSGLCGGAADALTAGLAGDDLWKNTICGDAGNPTLVQAGLDSIVVPDTIDMTLHSDVSTEFDELQAVAKGLATDAVGMFEDHRRRSNSTFAEKLIQSLAAFIVAAAGMVVCATLIRGQDRYLVEQSVVESDFHATATKVRLQPTTLRSVDVVLRALGAMDSIGGSLDEAGQIEMHLRVAMQPLTRIRPFVPAYMFLRTSTTNMERSHMVDPHMLNLTRGIKKVSTSMLYIGLGKFNEDGADTEAFSRLLPIVQRCTAHFRGSIAQISSGAILSTFTRALVNEDEEDERLEDGEVLATHAAFAILSLSSTSVDTYTSETAPIPVRMVITNRPSLEGVLSFHVTTHRVILSSAIIGSTLIEPLSDVHDAAILTDAATNDLINDYFLTKPVHFLKKLGSVYQVVLEEPDESVPNREEIVREQEKLREKCTHWRKAWERYEALMQADTPTYEMLEDAYRDLEAYKVFTMTHEEQDTSFSIANSNIKRIAAQMGVSLGSTLEED